MSDYIELTWEVEDGYAGKSRPQTTRIQLSDLHDCADVEEVQRFVAETIQEDFDARIAPGWDDSEMDKAIDAWKSMPDFD